MATPAGGFDYQFVDTPSDMFLCKICHLPSKKPHLSVCCGHTFCESCLDGTKKTNFFGIASCPMCRSTDFNTFLNKQNDRAIKSLLVFCTNKNKGCDWQGEINDITGHLGNSDGCHFEEVECTNDCGLLLQRQNLSRHLDNECPYREVCCQYCSMTGQYQFIMAEHEDQCPKVPLPCPNSCGVDSILREDMKVHKTTCPLEEIECPNNCGETLQRQLMDNHAEVECSCCEVDCQYCQLLDEYQYIEGEHKKECPKLPLTCPNKCEIGSIPREKMDNHRKECPLEVTECKYYGMGCRDRMARKDQSEHEKQKMEEHLRFTSSSLTNCQTKIVELESEVTQNRALLKLLLGDWTMQLNLRALQSSTGDRVLPVIVRMPDYSSNKNWCSDPFYAHERGYKMQLKITTSYFRGPSYLSVSLSLTKGPYDDELAWPMKGKFQVKLLNQTSDSSHHLRANNVENTCMPTYCDKTVWQSMQFIRTTSLSQFLKHDSLIFEVSKVAENSTWWKY